MRSTFLIVFAAGMFTACNNDLPKQSIVNKLRVLAVRADPAELVVGATSGVSFTALAVDVSGAPIDLRWALCPLPANLPPPPLLGCPGPAGIDLPGPHLDLSQVQTQPFSDSFYRTQDGTPLTSTQQAAVLSAGTTVVVGFSAAAGGERLDGFEELPLRDTAAPVNLNPGMQALEVNGAEMPADGSFVLKAGVKVRLAPVPAAGAKEIVDGKPEALNFTFFATEGDVASLRSADQTATGEAADSSIDYTAPSTPGPVQFWVVVRDGRGGVGWLTRTATVR